MPAPKGFGRPRTVDLREIFNAVFYVQRSGCQWEMLPHDFPHHGTVYKYFQKWERGGIWQKIHDSLRHQLREKIGRKEKSTVASALFTISRNDRKKGEVYGYDGGKKVKGRKRHLVVDSQGFIVGALVTEGNTPERLGAAMVILEHQEELSDPEVIWVDSGYSGQNFREL